MHLSTLSLVEKIWIDDLFEQHAKMLRDGWNTIEVTTALVLPRRKICSVSPLSALKTFSFVPLIEAVQIKVPSGFTVM